VIARSVQGQRSTFYCPVCQMLEFSPGARGRNESRQGR
jgi:hypothetical protein